MQDPTTRVQEPQRTRMPEQPGSAGAKQGERGAEVQPLAQPAREGLERGCKTREITQTPSWWHGCGSPVSGMRDPGKGGCGTLAERVCSARACRTSTSKSRTRSGPRLPVIRTYSAPPSQLIQLMQDLVQPVPNKCGSAEPEE